MRVLNVCGLLRSPDPAIVELVPPWLQAAGRRFYLDDLLGGEALPRVKDIAEIVSGHWRHKHMDVVRGNDELAKGIALAVEILQRVGDQCLAFRKFERAGTSAPIQPLFDRR